ncbi:MAG TPA: hypothetical protein DEF45_02135 [Rhodopirellula sp.]|nr:hypothetical protein [Rhodopirellula sp.]
MPSFFAAWNADASTEKMLSRRDRLDGSRKHCVSGCLIHVHSHTADSWVFKTHDDFVSSINAFEAPDFPFW